MPSGFFRATNSKNGDVKYYIRKNECEMSYSANLESEILKSWKQIEQKEKSVRVDSRVRKNITLSLPNNLTKEEGKKLVEFLQKKYFKNNSVLYCFHRGEKGKVKNKHLHILFNERDLVTGKKNRYFTDKKFLVDFKKDYQAYFKFENVEEMQRERIPTALWKVDEEKARIAIANFKEQHKTTATQKVEVSTYGKKIDTPKIVELEIDKEKILADILKNKNLDLISARNERKLMLEQEIKQAELKMQNESQKGFFGRSKKLIIQYENEIDKLKDEYQNVGKRFYEKVYVNGSRESTLVETSQEQIAKQTHQQAIWTMEQKKREQAEKVERIRRAQERAIKGAKTAQILPKEEKRHQDKPMAF